MAHDENDEKEIGKENVQIEEAVERLTTAFLNSVSEFGMHAHVTIINPVIPKKNVVGETTSRSWYRSIGCAYALQRALIDYLTAEDEKIREMARIEIRNKY